MVRCKDKWMWVLHGLFVVKESIWLWSAVRSGLSRGGRDQCLAFYLISKLYHNKTLNGEKKEGCLASATGINQRRMRRHKSEDKVWCETRAKLVISPSLIFIILPTYTDPRYPGTCHYVKKTFFFFCWFFMCNPLSITSSNCPPARRYLQKQ